MSFTVTVLRHANASPAAEKTHQGDLARCLSVKGMAQAKARREALNSRTFDAVFTSPAKRASDTAAIVAEEYPPSICPLDALCFDPPDTDIGKIFDGLFNKLGYAPLVDYLVSKDGDLVRAHGDNAWAVLMSQLKGTEKDILVVGHAVITPAMAFSQIEDVKSPLAKKLLDCNLGECEGYVVLVEDGKIVNVEMLN